MRLERQEEKALLSICDDGRGFEPEAASPAPGLENMKKRAASIRGSLRIVSKPGQGTKVCVEVSPSLTLA